MDKMKGKNRILHGSAWVNSWCFFFCPLSSFNKNTEISFWQTIKIEWCVIFVFRMPIEMPKKNHRKFYGECNSISGQQHVFILMLTFCCMFSFPRCVFVCVCSMFVSSESQNECNDMYIVYIHRESNREVCIHFIRMHTEKFDYTLVLTIIPYWGPVLFNVRWSFLLLLFLFIFIMWFKWGAFMPFK